jgi:hypothetical protein
VQGGFVALGDVLRQGADVGVAEHGKFLAAVLELAQHRQHRAGIGLLALDGNGGEDFLHRESCSEAS